MTARFLTAPRRIGTNFGLGGALIAASLHEPATTGPKPYTRTRAAQISGAFARPYGSHEAITRPQSDQVSLPQLRTKGRGRCSLDGDEYYLSDLQKLTKDFMGVVHHGSGVVTGEEILRGCLALT